MSDIKSPQEVAGDAHLEDGGAQAPDQDEQVMELEEDKPVYWAGAMSGVAFSARLEDGSHKLSMRIDAEIPIIVHNYMHDMQTLELHAQVMDFVFKVAIDDGDVEDVEIINNAMALAYARNFLSSTYEALKENIDDNHSRIDVGAQNKVMLEKTHRSLVAIDRISRRINQRLTSVVPASSLSAIDNEMIPRLSN